MFDTYINNGHQFLRAIMQSSFADESEMSNTRKSRNPENGIPFSTLGLIENPTPEYNKVFSFCIILQENKC